MQKVPRWGGPAAEAGRSGRVPPPTTPRLSTTRRKPEADPRSTGNRKPILAALEPEADRVSAVRRGLRVQAGVTAGRALSERGGQCGRREPLGPVMCCRLAWLCRRAAPQMRGLRPAGFTVPLRTQASSAEVPASSSCGFEAPASLLRASVPCLRGLRDAMGGHRIRAACVPPVTSFPVISKLNSWGRGLGTVPFSVEWQ